MFGEQFYPTPDEIIEKMVDPYLKKTEGLKYERFPHTFKSFPQGSVILEPSAGSGAILDWIKKEVDSRVKCYACEIDPELRSMLQGKDYQVIEEDFLDYQGHLLVDYIIMNPPFANGADHLLHAWKILDRGHIVCLLNEETVLNQNSEKRKVIKSLIDQFGSVEYLGSCFEDAQRKTNVRVAMVRLEKKASKTILDFDFDYEQDKKFSFEEVSLENQVQIKDTVGNMLLNFEEGRKAFLEFMEAAKKLKFYLQPITNEHFDPIKFSTEKLTDIKYNGNRQVFNEFQQDIQALMWRKTLNEMEVRKYLTNAVLKNFEEFLKVQGAMVFSKENIWKTVQMIFDNRGNIMEECIQASFEYLTKYTVDNRMEVEGWKTNEKYKVNRKVILPNLVGWGESYDTADWKKNYGCKFRVRSVSQLDDVERALAYLSGTDYNNVQTVSMVLNKRFDRLGQVKTGEEFDSSELDSTFFKVRFWKKGTVHITFKDERLWDEFNMRACYRKNWLPDEEAKAYSERKRREAREKQAAYQEPEQEQLLLELF